MKSKILHTVFACCLGFGLAVATLVASPDAAAQGICETDEGRFYGPVRPGQNLWTISQATAPAGANVARMAAAIRRINPRAFINGNANQLRTCLFLRLPNQRDLRRVSNQDLQRILSQ